MEKTRQQRNQRTPLKLCGGCHAVPLSEVVKINPHPSKDKLADDSLVSFIPMKCVEAESGRFEPLGDRKVAEVRKGYTSFRDGDVLFAKVTPCMENGKGAVMKGLTNGIGFGSTEFFVLRPADCLDVNYLFHFILQSSFRQQAARNMTGAVGLRRVPKSYLEQQTIPLPPLPEQHRIVSEIEKQFTRLDAGVSALKRVQANLKRYRAAVLKAACEGKFVPTEAELAGRDRSYESGSKLLTRILAERRKNWQGRGQYKEPAAPDTTTLPKLPKGWVWTNVATVCERVVDCHNKTAPYTENGIPLVRTTNIRNGKINLEETKFVSQPTYEFWSRRCIPRQGDVLFTREAPMGEAGIIPDDTTLCMGQRMMLMRASSGVFNHYLLATLLAPGLINHITRTAVGSGVKHLRVHDVELLPIPLPPLAEQTRIVAEVERRLSVVDELEATVSANLQRATSLRQAVLQKAFSGELG